MGQKYFPDNIPPVVRASGTTLTLATTFKGQPTRITVGGQQYKPASTITLSTATTGFNGIDTGSFAAGTIYNVFAVVSSGVLGMVITTSTTPTGFTSYTFLAKMISATGATISHVMNIGEAFVEYVYNTATADSTDTTSFGYGIDGVLIGAFSTARQKRIRYLQAAAAGDTQEIELYQTLVTNPQWMRVGVFATQGTDTINGFNFQGANSYGMELKYPGSGSTDVDVLFGNYAQMAAVSYAGVGSAWSSYSNVKWRVKKVSGPVTTP